MLTGDRDLEREAAVTMAAARELGIEERVAKALSTFALCRAGTGPVRDPGVRDMGRETLEELADARNYLVWWRSDPDVTQDEARRVEQALASVARAYEHVLAAGQHRAGRARPSRRALAEAIDVTGARWPKCRCPLDARMTDDELVALGCGCTHPNYCCPRLATVRRKVFK